MKTKHCKGSTKLNIGRPKVQFTLPFITTNNHPAKRLKKKLPYTHMNSRNKNHKGFHGLQKIIQPTGLISMLWFQNNPSPFFSKPPYIALRYTPNRWRAWSPSLRKKIRGRTREDEISKLLLSLAC